MIIKDFEQQSPEWYRARLGIPTGSGFSKIITPTGKPSSSAQEYRGELLAEWFLIDSGDQFSSEWIDRGILTEPAAVSAYEIITGINTEKVGIILRDDEMVGVSPDRLINDNGGLEIKCPKASTHMNYLLQDTLPPVYRAQVQGNLWISEREWWDFMSYHPAVVPFITRVYRDEKYISTMAGLMDKFVTDLLEAREKFKPVA